MRVDNARIGRNAEKGLVPLSDQGHSLGPRRTCVRCVFKFRSDVAAQSCRGDYAAPKLWITAHGLLFRSIRRAYLMRQ